MTLDGSNNSSTKSKSRLETHELLDRFELLYDNVDELKDLRRAVLDPRFIQVYLIGTNTKTRHLFNEQSSFRKKLTLFRIVQAIDGNENIARRILLTKVMILKY